MKTFTCIAELKNTISSMGEMELHEFFSSLGLFCDEEECFHGYVEINGKERFIESWYSRIQRMSVCSVLY